MLLVTTWHWEHECFLYKSFNFPVFEFFHNKMLEERASFILNSKIEALPLKSEISQGCLLSPILFNFFQEPARWQTQMPSGVRQVILKSEGNQDLNNRDWLNFRVLTYPRAEAHGLQRIFCSANTSPVLSDHLKVKLEFQL